MTWPKKIISRPEKYHPTFRLITLACPTLVLQGWRDNFEPPPRSPQAAAEAERGARGRRRGREKRKRNSQNLKLCLNQKGAKKNSEPLPNFSYF